MIIDLVGVRERFDFDVDDKYLDFFIAGVGIRDGVRLRDDLDDPGDRI